MGFGHTWDAFWDTKSLTTEATESTEKNIKPFSVSSVISVVNDLLDVEVLDVEGIILDKFASRLDLVAH